MSGHSKWSTIKRKKAKVDAQRSKSWSKRARDIMVAARMWGPDPDANPRLRMAIDKAKSENMPNDNIDRAIKKGAGELGGASYEEIVYEGYGPGGVAVLCQVVTDNRNRTAGEIRKVFDRCGGNLGASNSVAWSFHPRGVIVVSAEDAAEDRVFEIAVSNGAADVSSSRTIHEITCDPAAFQQVKAAMEQAGIAIQSAEISMVAENQVTLDLGNARKVTRLIELLDEHDDVQSVASNFDIPDDVLAQLEAD